MKSLDHALLGIMRCLLFVMGFGFLVVHDNTPGVIAISVALICSHLSRQAGGAQ